MFSLFVRNLIFTILQPGIVAGLIPYLILRNQWTVVNVHEFKFIHYSGIILFLMGLVIMFHCIINFAVKGRGTLSPADPTRRLVIAGLYRFSRNPMYVGVMLILIGESVFSQSTDLWIYSLVIFSCFHIFIVLVEEPRLKRDFGDEYNQYRERVRRWV